MTGDTGPDDEPEEGVTDDSPPADRGESSLAEDSPSADVTGGSPGDGTDPPTDDAPADGRSPDDGENTGIAGDGGSAAGDPPGGDDPSGSLGGSDDRDRADDGRGPDPERVEGLVGELESLRNEVDRLEDRVEEKTVHRDDLEAELRRYVRARQRRGHATGWGPYLVLLYGVVMTVGAFFYLGGLVALGAMIVVWLSTLGLYVVMVIVSTGLSVGRRVAGLRDLIGRFR